MDKRVAFITGASRGIGRAVALALGRAGYDLAAAATVIETNEEATGEIRAACPTALFVNVDVRSPESVKNAFARALKEKSRIGVLVNNAGITRDGLAVRMKAEDWDAVLDTNLGGAFLA